MTVVDLQPKRKRNTAPRYAYVPIDQNSGAGRFYNRMVREVEADLGGRRKLSRVSLELVRAFCGAATALQSLNRDVLLGDHQIDYSAYATIASTMLRIGSRLGLQRCGEPRLPDPLDYARQFDEAAP
jgi:hypothetical protein